MQFKVSVGEWLWRAPYGEPEAHAATILAAASGLLRERRRVVEDDGVLDITADVRVVDEGGVERWLPSAGSLLCYEDMVSLTLQCDDHASMGLRGESTLPANRKILRLALEALTRAFGSEPDIEPDFPSMLGRPLATGLSPWIINGVPIASILIDSAVA